MTLWAMIRSPLMFGGDLRYNDEWTTALLTNEEVLRITKASHGNRQLYRDGDLVAWTADGRVGRMPRFTWPTLIWEKRRAVATDLVQLGLDGNYLVRDLWARKEMATTGRRVVTNLPPHGALWKLTWLA